MPHHDPDDEDWYDQDGDDSGLDPADAVPCPECGAEIYADLDHCPQCGYWLTEADRRTRDPSLFQSRGVRNIALMLLVIFVIALLAGALDW